MEPNDILTIVVNFIPFTILVWPQNEAFLAFRPKHAWRKKINKLGKKVNITDS